MFRSLAGPYRTAHIMMIVLCLLIGFWVIFVSPIPSDLKTAFIGIVILPLIYYFIFRTASAHYVRISKQSSRQDLYFPFVNIACYGTLFGVGLSSPDGELPYWLMPVFFLTFYALLAPFYIAGRKFTEVRGFQPNFGASLGWAFVHYYWIIGFYWLLKHTRLEGQAIPTADHP